MTHHPLSQVPDIRITPCAGKPIDVAGEYVLYWMLTYRRTSWNFSLDRAIDWSLRLGKPLLVVETLSCGLRWNCNRFHRFILDGMADTSKRLEYAPVFYYPYVESLPGSAIDLLAVLAKRACVVVTDLFPCDEYPALVAAVAALSPVLVEAIDSNGLLPLRAPVQAYPSAHAFRHFLKKHLLEHLAAMPHPDPLSAIALAPLTSKTRQWLLEHVLATWPAPSPALLAGDPDALNALPIDHAVYEIPVAGGASAAQERLSSFLARAFSRYAEYRNAPQEMVTSRLSPYLHAGHMATQQIFQAIAERDGWTPHQIPSPHAKVASSDALHFEPDAAGGRIFWGMSPEAEAFLDELIVWRELGLNTCAFNADYNQYDALPAWARQTLADHAHDPRPYLYSREAFEHGQTHDPLWNATQMQLVREGWIHPYLRMLWGKKILEWSPCPEQALATMIDLNNTYALDGRNPNSYSGIFWILGRYDRPWGPERPIFGKIRYMSSQNTARKVEVDAYVRQYAP